MADTLELNKEELKAISWCIDLLWDKDYIRRNDDWDKEYFKVLDKINSFLEDNEE